MTFLQKSAAGIKDKISHVSIRISPAYEQKVISEATGFFYQYDNKNYLITNWHNVSGRDPNNLKPISPTCSIPDSLALRIPYVTPSHACPEKGQIYIKEWKVQGIELYEDKERKNPVWYQHPKHGISVDVVAIEIENDLSAADIYHVNNKKLNLDEIPIFPGSDVFVTGFPEGFTGGGHLPIWKRGSLATEPDVDIEDLPKMFIDTATRKGMSGSPVFTQYTGYWIPKGKTPKDAIIGSAKDFLGVYSGRVGDDTFLAQLGIVWKKRVIEEIIIEKSKGTSSFFL